MSSFRPFARRLLKRPGSLSFAIGMAFVSAGGMGAGLLGLLPTLELILGGEGASLRSIAEGYPKWISPGLLGILPTDRFISVVWLIGGLIILTLVGATASFLHTTIAFRLSAQTVGDIRRDAFRHALHLPIGKVAGQTSDLISRLMNDTEVLLLGFLALTSKTVAQLTKGVISVSVAFIIDWQLTLIALLVAPILYTVIRKLGKRIRRASRSVLQARSELLNSATEALQGMRVVKVYSSERRELNRFSEHNDETVRQLVRTLTIRAFSTPLNEALTVLFLAGLALLASRAIINGTMELPTFIAAMAALGAAAASIKPLTRAIQQVQMSEPAAARLLELLDEEPEPMWTIRGSGSRRPRLSRHSESIEFENVSLTYPGANDPALDGISLHIKQGSTIAFVGPNGSGKTTLLSLVPRLYEPDSGRVLIDGHDLATMDLRSLRRQIGVVTQETVIFRGTIRSNIAYGRQSAASPPAEEEIIAAAKRARAHDFIMDLPGGYDAVVGEQGATLSGGQRQRLAIARAILRDPAILILDEATSMIDADSERRIADALDEFSQGRTCLIVAHRLSTVCNADQIVVLDRGRISAVGTHDELLESSPLYQTLARTQLVAAPV